jgi:hypothetical protein
VSAARLCSCGDPRPHEVMRRATADGIVVVLWSDGDVTDRLGTKLGSRIGSPEVARVAVGEVCIATARGADRATLPGLLRAATLVWRSTGRDRGVVRAAIDRVRRIGHVRPGLHMTASIGADGIVRVGREQRS